jgi:hypothetical protein
MKFDSKIELLIQLLFKDILNRDIMLWGVNKKRQYEE